MCIIKEDSFPLDLSPTLRPTTHWPCDVHFMMGTLPCYGYNAWSKWYVFTNNILCVYIMRHLLYCSWLLHYFLFIGLRPSLISGPFPLNGLTNGHGTVGPHSFSSMSTLSLANGHSDNSVAMDALEQEVQKLQFELKQSQDLVKQLKEREMQLVERYNELR